MNKYQIIQRARELRKNQTKAEGIFWNLVRNRRFMGLKFNRQHPIIYESIGSYHAFFIADFYCSQLKLVIEIDGPIHEFRKEEDRERTEILRTLKIQVLRIQNSELDHLMSLRKKLSDYIRNQYQH